MTGVGVIIQRHLYKEYDAGKAAAKIKALETKLLAGGREAAAGKILNDLYSIAFFAIKQEQTVILLQTAELLKLAYGQKYCRPDEDVYWREICFAALGKRNFQAVEYFLEGGKLLFKNLPEKRPVFAALFKMTGVMAMREGKFFIGACIIKIFLPWLSKLDAEEDATISAVISCLENIGAAVIKTEDIEFFREISTLLSKNMQPAGQEQTPYWDKLFVSWLCLVLDSGNKDNINTFTALLSSYGAIRNRADFYALLISMTGRFFGKIDDAALKHIIDRLVIAGVNCGQNPAAVAQSLEKVFKTAVNCLGWRRALPVFTCWFAVCRRFLAQKGVVDVRQLSRREFLSESGRALTEAAVLAALAEKEPPPALLWLWRQWLLGKNRTAGARKRTANLFCALAREWSKRYPLQAEKEKELLWRLEKADL